MQYNIIFLQQGTTPVIINMLFFLSIFAIMYFFFIRPSVKKQKQQQAFTEELSKGKEVVTTSGIIGRINKIENGIVHLMVAEKTYIRVVKGAISKEMTEQLGSNKKESVGVSS